MSPKQKPLLITDLDGTILQSMEVAWEYLNKVAKKKQKSLKPYKAYTSMKDFYTDVFHTFGIRSLKLLPRMRRYMYLEDKKVQTYPGAIEGLKKILDSGFDIAIVTDNDDDYARKVLENNGLYFKNNLRLYTGETESKLNIIAKLMKEYKDSPVFFASHDFKDFLIADIASALRWKRYTKIFTPNEIDKNSNITHASTIANLAPLLNSLLPKY